jgi:hypothetical protein
VNLRWTRVGRFRRVGKSENWSSRTHRDLVTQNRDLRFRDKICTVHLVDTWQRSTPSGKSRQRVSHSVFEVHREIGNPGDE